MFVLLLRTRVPPVSTRTDTLFPYTTLFRSRIGLCREVGRLLSFDRHAVHRGDFGGRRGDMRFPALPAQAVQYGRGDERIEFVEAVEGQQDRKSTRLNSSH